MKKVIRNIKNLDYGLFSITALLFLFGLIMVYSASSVTAYMVKGADPFVFFQKQLLFILFGVTVGFFVINIDIKRTSKLAVISIPIIIGALIFLLVSSSVRTVNNANSWIGFGRIKLQPSEFAKIAIIFYMAYYYDKHKNGLKKMGTLFIPVILSIFMALLILKQPDLGTCIIFSSIVLFMFLANKIPKNVRTLIYTLLISGVLLIGLLYSTGGLKKILSETQYSRLKYARPCDRIFDDGNQVCNGFIAINNGNIKGVGLGNSTQKYLYLPEPHTDFIFDIIVEEFGLISAIILIGSYIFILYRILAIGRNSSNNLGALLCYGVAIYISLHIIINLGGILAIIPLTGVPLPFMSYGGSFTSSLIVALSAVQRVNIENKKA